MQERINQLDIDAIPDTIRTIGLVGAADDETLDISLMDVVIAVIDIP